MLNKFVLLIATLLPITATAQVIHHHGPAVTEIPQNFSVGSQYYDLNVKGLRQYVDANPDASDMNPLLRELEGQQKTADIVKWSMVGVGAVIAVGSFTFLQTEIDFGDEGEEDIEKSWNGGAFVGGVAIGIAGYWAQKWLQPDRDDYLNFINRHNAREGREPLKLNLGWNFEMSQPTLVTSLRF